MKAILILGALALSGCSIYMDALRTSLSDDYKQQQLQYRIEMYDIQLRKHLEEAEKRGVK